LKLVFFIMMPATVGLIILREPIVALLFQRGEFDAQATRLTAQALLYYSMGLWAFSAVRIVAVTFFALQDTRTPVRMAGISILANIVLGVVLMRPLAHGGLALATALASMLNLGLLLSALRTRLGRLGWKSIGLSVCRSLVCSIVMGIGVHMAALFMVPNIDCTLSGLAGGVAGSIAVGLIIYGAGSYLIKSPELSLVIVEAGKGIDKKWPRRKTF